MRHDSILVHTGILVTAYGGGVGVATAAYVFAFLAPASISAGTLESIWGWYRGVSRFQSGCPGPLRQRVV